MFRCVLSTIWGSELATFCKLDLPYSIVLSIVQSRLTVYHVMLCGTGFVVIYVRSTVGNMFCSIRSDGVFQRGLIKVIDLKSIEVNKQQKSRSRLHTIPNNSQDCIKVFFFSVLPLNFKRRTTPQWRTWKKTRMLPATLSQSTPGKESKLPLDLALIYSDTFSPASYFSSDI